MKSTGRRRGWVSWFVEPYRQIKLGLLFLTINLTFSALILGVFGYYLLDVYSTLSIYFDLSSEQGKQVLDKLAIPLFAGVGLILIFVVTTILISARYTFAIYGPLVSIHRFIDALISSEEVTPLELRESDQLKDLAEKLNILSDRLKVTRLLPLSSINRYLDNLITGEAGPLVTNSEMDMDGLVKKLNSLRELVKRGRKAG